MVVALLSYLGDCPQAPATSTCFSLHVSWALGVGAWIVDVSTRPGHPVVRCCLYFDLAFCSGLQVGWRQRNGSPPVGNSPGKGGSWTRGLELASYACVDGGGVRNSPHTISCVCIWESKATYKQSYFPFFFVMAHIFRKDFFFYKLRLHWKADVEIDFLKISLVKLYS